MKPWEALVQLERASLLAMHETIEHNVALLDKATTALDLAECPIECIQHVTANIWGIVIALNKEGNNVPTPEQARVIIVALTRTLGPAEKNKNEFNFHDKDSLSVVWGKFPAPQVTLTHYRPAECRLETKTRIIPATPAIEEHVEEYTEIVCDKGSEADNEPVEGAVAPL